MNYTDAHGINTGDGCGCGNQNIGGDGQGYDMRSGYDFGCGNEGALWGDGTGCGDSHGVSRMPENVLGDGDGIERRFHGALFERRGDGLGEGCNRYP